METVGRTGRTLLGLRDSLPLSHEPTALDASALILTTVAMIVVIIVVVAICVCNQNSSPQLTTVSPRKPTIDGIANHTPAPQVTTNDVAVEIPVDSATDPLLRSPNSPDSLSEVNKRESGTARTSATLSRQLPDPPVAKDSTQGLSPPETHAASGADQRKSSSSHTSDQNDELDDYDRLHQPKSTSVDDPGYDHVDSQTLPEERNSVSQNRENIYATPVGESSDSGSGTVTVRTVAASSHAIRENIYAVPTGEPADSGSGIVGLRENDYNVPTGEDDANYSTIPSRKRASITADDTDTEYDPYARIDSGNKVTPRLVVMATDVGVDSDLAAAACANTSPPAIAPSSDNVLEREADVSQMYASVSRENPSPGSQTTPPALPDRGYEPEEVGSLPGSGSHFQLNDVTADSGINVDNSIDNDSRIEPSYTEVTARESLASMQQRQSHMTASSGGAAAGYQPYRDIPENYYARVDGSSGDGAFSAQGAVALDERPNRSSEMYSEINTSGGSYQTISVTANGPESLIPAPPPVASLPQLRQSSYTDARRSHDGGPEHTEEGYAIVSQASKRGQARLSMPVALTVASSRSVDENLGLNGQGDVRRVTGAVNRLAENRRSAPLATVESDHDLSIDFTYQSVKDVPELENESDFDPNYETVEETKKKARSSRNNPVPRSSRVPRGSKVHQVSKVPSGSPVPVSSRAHVNGAASGQHGRPVRGHEYEEVTELKQSGVESAYQVKKRVLMNHCYEDISEVKEEQQRQKKREL